MLKVLGWNEDRIKKEWKFIQTFTQYKYDEYQHFKLGTNFIRNFAIWLNQFEDTNEKEIAYTFIKEKLIFISHREMLHLTALVYPEIIKPFLIKRVSEKTHIPSCNLSQILETKDFEILKRKSLFLGLSDGARIDYFRRFSKELSHEQIWPIYDISIEKATDLSSKLKADLKSLSKEISAKECKFENIFLLDDFSGSGRSYIRVEKRKKAEIIKGKIKKFYDQILNSENKVIKNLISKSPYIFVILYVATDKAIKEIRKNIRELLDNNLNFEIRTLQEITERYCVKKQDELFNLIDRYYDRSIEDQHTKTGGSRDMKMGYARCALPLILYHNTPNNSIPLLWFYENCKIKGLFPRVNRHG